MATDARRERISPIGRLRAAGLAPAVGTTLVVLVTSSAGAAGTPSGLVAGWNVAAYAGAAVSLLGAVLIGLLRPHTVRALVPQAGHARA